MKYSPLSYKKEQVLKVDPPIKGINNYDKPSEIDTQQAVMLKNIVIENGCIKNRLGLDSRSQNLFDLDDFDDPFDIDFFVTDSEFSIGDNSGRIAVAYIKNDETAHIYRMFLVCGDSYVKKIGDIYFNRTSEYIFYTPTNIVFFNATPQTGGGLFAFLQLSNMYGTASTENRIYEIDEQYENWNLHSSTYIPTVYINGRGNAYEEAKINGSVYTGQPKELETINLLDGTFKAYFSSDGYSSLFRLPYSNLANASVSCKLYSDTTHYVKWVIYEGQTSSAEITLNGKSVKMHVDRVTGTVYFRCSNEIMPLPAMRLYPQNNVCFTASIDTDYSFDDIVSCKVSTSLGNKIFFSNGRKQNEIFVCDKDNPFYFPQCFNNRVGDDGAKVTALCSTGEEVYAFKETGVYTVKLKGEKEFNKTTLFSDDTSYFKDLGDFTITRISNNSGCDNPATLKIVGKNPVWFSKSGEVFSVKNNTVKRISQCIDKKTLEIFKDNTSVAAVALNSYILMNKNLVFVLDIKENSQVSYFWELPPKINLLGAVSNGDKTAFIVNTDLTLLFYTAQVSGENDTVLISKTKSDTYKIEKVIDTKNFLNGGLKKRINRIVLDCEFNKELQFEVIGNSLKEKFLLSRNDITKENEIDVILGEFGTKSVLLSLKTKGKLVFKGAEIFYS